MTVDEEKAKQDKVRLSKESCDHIGYFVGFGMEVYPMAGKFLIITAQNCMMCGKTFATATVTDSPIPIVKEEEEKKKFIS